MDFYFFEDQHNRKVLIEEFLNDSSDDNRSEDEEVHMHFLCAAVLS